jgi:hypothetical protein
MRKPKKMTGEKIKNGLKDSLYKAGVVADLTISDWQGTTKLTPEDLGLTSLPEEGELIRLGKKLLLHKDSLQKVRAFKFEAQTFLYDNSFQFPFGATQFVPYLKLSAMIEKMEKCKAGFEGAVEEFLKEYDRIREEVLAEYGVFFERILRERNHITESEIQFEKERLLRETEKKYPSVSELRRKFRFQFSVFEVNLPDFKDLTSEEALDKARLNVELENEYRQRVLDKIDGFLDEVHGNLKQLALDTVEYLKKRVEGGRLNIKTVKAFMHYADTFKEMDFVGFDVSTKIDDVRKKLADLSKEDLNDEEFQKKLLADVEAIKDDITHTDKDRVLGKFKRHIEMEEEEVEEATA